MVNTKGEAEKTNTAHKDGINETDDIKVLQNRIRKNLEYIMKKNRIVKRKDLADKLGVEPPQFTRIMNGKQLPTLYPFFVMFDRCRDEFGCSVDEFLFKDLEEEDKNKREINGAMVDLPVASYMKFEGLFQAYYYDASSVKERERSKDKDALRSGLVYVYKNPGAKDEKKHFAVAVLNMGKEEADQHFKKAQIYDRLGRTDIKSYITTLGGSRHVYHGELELSAKHIYISLCYQGLKDKIQMIFHQPSGNSEQYIGGVGTMTLVTKGLWSSPCVQCIALSEASLDSSEEEIASHLLMHYPNVKKCESAEDLPEMMIQLYQDEEGQRIRLSDEQKKILVRNHMDKIIKETVERNLFRTVTVSADDDNKFYHYLKRIREKKVQEE